MSLCRQCRKLLRPLYTARGFKRKINQLRKLLEAARPGAREPWTRAIMDETAWYQRDRDRYGYDGRGHFCTQRCACEYAEAHAAAHDRAMKDL